MPDFPFEPSSSLLCWHGTTPMDISKGSEIGRKEEKQLGMHSPRLFAGSAQSSIKSRGIKTFLMYGRTGSVGICNSKLGQAGRYSPVRHTAHFVKLNIHLGFSTDF